MKKKLCIKIFSFLVFVGVLLTGILTERVCAKANNDYFYNGDYIPRTYLKKWKDGLGYYETARFLQRSDGQFAYCLQPFVSFVNGKLQTAYDSDYAIVTNMTQEQWNRVELLSYYGYQYQNHMDSKWYAITQFMIWKTVDPTSNMYFTDTLDGNRISLYENEMNELEQLVSNHSILPNFQPANHTISLNETITLYDANSVLSQFNIINDEKVITSINENAIRITGKQLGESTITLTKSDTKYSRFPIVYVDSEGQDLLVAGSYTPIVHTLSVNVVGGKIRITKVDSELETTTAQGQASLIGAVYHVFDQSHKLVSTLTIGNDYTATTDFLPFGSYTIEEVTTSTGYQLDSTIYSVTIDSNDIFDVTVRETVIKGRIKVMKVDSETNVCKAQGEATLVGAKYGIYDSKNELVEILTIGNDCSATSKNLPYGDYQVREVQSSMGYLIDSNSYNVSILNDTTIIITSKENVIKGKIKINKVDSETDICKAQGEATLVGAKYGIYNSKNELVEILTIGNDCSATSKNLPYGDYQVRELSAPVGYYLDDEVYLQSIMENIIYSVIVKEEIIQNQFEFYKLYGTVDTGVIHPEENAQFQVLNHKQEVVNTIRTDENGYATVKLPYGAYMVKQISGMIGYQWISPITIHVDNQTKLVQKFYLKDGNIMARLKLIKIDADTKMPILASHVTFKIKDKKTNAYICQTTDHIICEFETNEDGILYTPLPLASGEYLVEEVSAPVGYLLSDEFMEFTIQDNSTFIEDPVYGPVIELYFENQPVKGEVEIFKYGEQVVIRDEAYDYEQIMLQGVRFGLYDSYGNLIEERITDENGYVKINDLALGTYTLKELESIGKHMIDEQEYTFTLEYKDSNTPIISKVFIFENELPKGELKLIKVDSETGKELPNTEIKIYTENDKCIYHGFTDINGKINLTNLFIGKFYITEIKSVIGYQLNKNKLYFDVKENEQVIQIEMKNQKIKGDLEFMKVEKNTNKPLSDTVVEVYSENGELVRSGITDENGKIRFNRLEYGKYYIVEKKAKEGYTIFEGKPCFEIKEENEVVNFTIEDVKIKGTLEFLKVEEGTNKPLMGANVEIYREDGKLVRSGITDSDGKVVFEELEYGKYYVIEKDAPDGYTLCEDKIYFEMKENNQIISVMMEDSKIIEVPDTATTSYHKFSYVGILALILGFVSFTYGKVI